MAIFNMTIFSDFFFKKTCIFFKVFRLFCRFLGFSSLKSSGTSPKGLAIGYCIVSKCNEMLFKISTPRILFLQNLQFFSIFSTFIVIIQVFQPNKNSPFGFDNKLLENVFHGLVFNFFITNFFSLCNFFKFFFRFLKFFLSFFRFLQPQEPHNLL